MHRKHTPQPNGGGQSQGRTHSNSKVNGRARSQSHTRSHSGSQLPSQRSNRIRQQPLWDIPGQPSASLPNEGPAMKKNLRAQLEQNFRVLRRHHNDLLGIVDFTNHAVLYRYAHDSGDWEKEGIEGTLFVLEFSCSANQSFALKIMNRLTPDDYLEVLTPSHNIHFVDEYIIYQTANDCIMGLWIYQEKDRPRITNCLKQCCASLADDPLASRPRCIYSLLDYIGKSKTPGASNQAEKLIELYEKVAGQQQSLISNGTSGKQSGHDTVKQLTATYHSKLDDVPRDRTSSTSSAVALTADLGKAQDPELTNVRNKLASTVYNSSSSSSSSDGITSALPSGNPNSILDALNAIRPTLSRSTMGANSSNGGLTESLHVSQTPTTAPGMDQLHASSIPPPHMTGAMLPPTFHQHASALGGSAFAPHSQQHHQQHLPPPHPWGFVPPIVVCPNCNHHFPPFMPMATSHPPPPPPPPFAQMALSAASEAVPFASNTVKFPALSQPSRPQTAEATQGRISSTPLMLSASSSAADPTNSKRSTVTQSRAAEFLQFVQNEIGGGRPCFTPTRKDSVPPVPKIPSPFIASSTAVSAGGHAGASFGNAAPAAGINAGEGSAALNDLLSRVKALNLSQQQKSQTQSLSRSSEGPVIGGSLSSLQPQSSSSIATESASALLSGLKRALEGGNN
ncbi:hypothetical protein EV182_001615 [Spiromyces aspiralis]|uniref:Uncharacterized protein n=1 Tax=Spiromyces aspiralis TaxID=68401 RepID=A0ACC1HUD4_9FUNG|nr:hypothetical protein EV182_001615 [Spiromyces aspiralis]